MMKNKVCEIMGADEGIKQKKVLKLIDLDTECLMKIFVFLSYKDLFSLRKVHAHYHNAVDYVLIANSKKRNKAPTLIICDEDIKLIKKYLEFVGNKMKYLKIDIEQGLCRLNTVPTVKSLIETYCNGGNIKYCSFNRFYINQTFVNKNIKFFNDLERLELHHCDMSQINLKLFLCYVAASSLKELQVTGYGLIIKPFNIFPIIAVSKLETCIMDLYNPSDHREYKTQMPTNLTLKTLNLGSYKYETAIIQNFPNIENLSYAIADDAEAVQQLKNLKKLVFSGVQITFCFNCLTELSKRNNLETLVLDFSGCIWFEDVQQVRLREALTKMTNLKELKLNLTEYNFSHLEKVAEHLTKLQKLHIQVHTIKSTSNMVIKTILGFVKASKFLRFLHVKLPLPSDKHQKLYDDIVNVRRTAGFNEVLQLNFGYCSEKISTLEEQKRYVRCNGKMAT